jgi:hypothetical protein
LEIARASSFDGRADKTDNNGNNVALPLRRGGVERDLSDLETPLVKTSPFIIKETRPLCKRFFDFFPKTGG